jgi:hypothetical protein
MSLDGEQIQNKMMTGAPKEKAGFHFAGDGVWNNMFIWAENIEEATKEWLRTRKLIVSPDSTAGLASSDLPSSTAATAPEAPQSTAANQEEIKE